MKLTTITLAIALAVPSTAAFAQGGMSFGSHAVHPYSGSVHPYSGVTVGSSRPIASRPRNFSGNTLGPIAHDPSGSTLSGSAMIRGG